jgi:hypothetical protein
MASSTASVWNANVSLRISPSGIDGDGRSTHRNAPCGALIQFRSMLVGASTRPSRCRKMVISLPP